MSVRSTVGSLRWAAGIAALSLVAACGGGGNDPDGGIRGTTGPVTASVTTASPGTVSKPGVMEGFSTPESVLFATDRWFVSNIGTKPDAVGRDGDGYLTELNAVGTMTARRAMPRQGDPPLHAPKGMAHTGNRVFVADLDRVVGYDMDTHGQVFEAPVGGEQPTLLNDIAPLNDSTLLVSDSLRGIVYRLDLETKNFEPLATGIPGANGIAFDATGKTAYVAAAGEGFAGGELWRLDLTQNPVVPVKVGAVHGVLDGITVLSNGNIVVSDWAGAGEQPGTVTIYKPDGTVVGLVKLPDNLHGPADFAIDPAGRNLWIPAMPDNRVVIVALP